MTSSLSDANLKGDIIGHPIHLPSLTIIAFILAKLWRGDPESPWPHLPPPPPPGPRRQKNNNTGLDSGMQVPYEKFK